MANPIWIDLLTADNLPVTLNVTHIVGISVAPKASPSGDITYDQVVVNTVADVYPNGSAIWVKGTIDELKTLIEDATHKAR